MNGNLVQLIFGGRVRWCRISEYDARIVGIYCAARLANLVVSASP